MGTLTLGASRVRALNRRFQKDAPPVAALAPMPLDICEDYMAAASSAKTH